jgi:hypothetical protein
MHVHKSLQNKNFFLFFFAKHFKEQGYDGWNQKHTAVIPELTFPSVQSEAEQQSQFHNEGHSFPLNS